LSTDASERESLFQQLTDLLSHDDARVMRSTMMGFPCLRVDDKFFASAPPAA
jgi:hypothetical protein